MSRLLDRYPPSHIPLDKANLNEILHSDFEDLVKQVRKHHQKHGRSVSREEIVDRFDKLSQKHGMGVAEGRGFWGSVWSGLKNTLSNTASHLWQKFQDDPLGSINSVVSTLAPLIKTGEAVA